MAETWTRLLSSITDSSVWFEDDKTLRVWIALLAMSDGDGYVWASILGVAHRAQVTVEQAEIALRKFQEPDPKSRSKDFDGRRIEEVDRGWLILNKTRFRDMRDEDEHRRKERERKRAQRAKAKAEREAATPVAPAVAPDVQGTHDGSPTETIIPLDLTSKAERILPELLAGMKGVTLEQLRDGVREFVGYWTIGGGKFKRRNFWMKRLREDLRQKYEKGKFRPPGAIEHDERTGAVDKGLAAEREKIAKQRKLQREAMLPPKRSAAE